MRLWRFPAMDHEQSWSKTLHSYLASGKTWKFRGIAYFTDRRVVSKGELVKQGIVVFKQKRFHSLKRMFHIFDAADHNVSLSLFICFDWLQREVWNFFSRKAKSFAFSKTWICCFCKNLPLLVFYVEGAEPQSEQSYFETTIAQYFW